ncbi:unnamed protein product [Urochloa humidicola]
MPEDLVSRIVDSVLAAGDLLDYARFRAASRRWRAYTADPRGRGVSDPRFHPRRWTMLPDRGATACMRPDPAARLRGRARFFNHDTGAFVSARIPELGDEDDHVILGSPEGLLLLQRDADTAVAASSTPSPETIATVPSKLMMLPQLVECGSEMLVVGSTDISRSHLVVGDPASAAPLASIGEHCLFFGTRSMAVSSRGLLPSVAGDTVVLCDSIKGRLMRCNLADDTLSPACDGDIVRGPPPCPRSIVHHLVTSCFRYFWNKAPPGYNSIDSRRDKLLKTEETKLEMGCMRIVMRRWLELEMCSR